ncbi:hypothetical protein ACFLTI_01640 [Bacteroidota bacterium]
MLSYQDIIKGDKCGKSLYYVYGYDGVNRKYLLKIYGLSILCIKDE